MSICVLIHEIFKPSPVAVAESLKLPIPVMAVETAKLYSSLDREILLKIISPIPPTSPPASRFLSRRKAFPPLFFGKILKKFPKNLWE